MRTYRTILSGLFLVPLLPVLSGCMHSAVPSASASEINIKSLADPIAAIPVSSHPTASDAEIQKWALRVKTKSTDTAAWVSLGDALMQKARETTDASYYTHAERMYGRALEIDATKSSAMAGMAWVNGGRHEFEKSIEWGQRTLKIDPKSTDAMGLIGDANIEMGDYDAAFIHYQKMMDTKPDASSYARGAHALMLIGDMRKATWLMEKAIKAGGPYQENIAWCKSQLALMFFRTGAYMASKEVLTDALKSAPNNYQALAAMGKTKAALNDTAGAIECYQKAIDISPQLDSVIALGDLYTLTGKKSEAEKQFATVEAIYKLNRANGVRGDMQIAQFYADHDKNLPEALKLAEGEYLTRKNVYAADILAWCYFKNDRLADARKMIDIALAKNTPEALFLFHKGMICAKTGEIQEAKKALYSASSTSSKFHPILHTVAEAKIMELGSKSAAAGAVEAKVGQK